MKQARTRIVLGIAFWLLVAALTCTHGVSQVSLSIDRSEAPRYTVLNLTAAVPGQHAGSVQFLDDERTVLAVPLATNGTAVLSIASLRRGPHNLSAIFLTASGQRSTSNSVHVTINPLPWTFAPARQLREAAGKPFSIDLPALPDDASGTISISEAGRPLATSTLTPRQGTIERFSDLAPGEAFAGGPTQTHTPVFVYASNHDPAAKDSRPAALAWLAIPREYKHLPGDPDIAVDGPWLTLAGAFHNSAGQGVLTFPITSSGAPLYLWFRGTGTFAVSVDGIPTAENPSPGLALLRLPVLPGAHTLTVTLLSGQLDVLGIATPPSAGEASVHPLVLVYGAQQDVTLLAADGLNIQLALDDPAKPETPSSPVPLKMTLAQPGPHTLQLAYSGDDTYAPLEQTLHVEVKPRAQSRVTFTTSATIYPANAAIPLTATVAPSSATGSILFVEAGISLGGADLSAGSATVSLPLAPGLHTLAASYSGDPSNDPAVSPAVQIQVVPGPATLTLSPLPVEIVTGTAVPLTAAISPVSATGNVTFQDAFTPAGAGTGQVVALGQATLAAGLATLAPPTLFPGTHVLSAHYAGDDRNLAAASPALTIVVDFIPTITTLAPLPDAAYGTHTLLTATVAPGATGTVVFRDSVAGLLGQSAFAADTATLTTAPLATGTHTFTATYSGDPTHAPSTSAGVSATIHPATSTTTLTASTPSADAGTPVVFTATVAPATATGSLIFRESSGNLLGQANLASGSATLTLTALATGNYTISATYSGDLYAAPSTSTPISLTINAIPTSTTLSPIPPAGYGASINLAATVLPTTTTGLVTFIDAGKLLGTAPILNGLATLLAGSLNVGTHSLSATYPGDATHTASTSPAVTTVITQNATTTAATLAQTDVPAGGSILVNVKVMCSCTATPTGTINVGTFTAPLANGTPGIAYATLSLPAASLGAFTATASYSGDPSFIPSAAAPLPYNVIATPTSGILAISSGLFTLTSARVAAGTVVTLTVRITSSQPPTGTISFHSGPTLIASTPLDATGQAFTTLSPGIGVYAITAAYAPSGLFAGTVIPGQTLTVTAPLALSLDPTPIPLAAGGTATATLLVTPLSGFQGPATAQCISPVTYITCTVDPPGTLSGPIRLTIHLTAASKLTPGLMLLLPLALIRRRRRRRPLLPLLLLLLSGCATGGNFQSLPTGPQTLHLQVTAAGVVADAPLTVDISD